MHYYKFNIADWHLATSHLTLEEEAVYFRLINYYYDTEQPIPKETQSVSRRLRLGKHSSLVDVLLKEFFVLKDDGWHHDRCNQEIAQYHQKAEVNQANGKNGGRPKKTQSVSKENPDITLTTNHKPITNNHNISAPDGVSSEVWNDFKKLRDKQRAPITETALKGLAREAEKAKMPLQEVLQMCCERGWRGFKAEWVKEQQTAAGNDKSWMFSNQGIEAKAAELGVNSYGVANHQQLKDKILQVLAMRAMQ